MAGCFNLTISLHEQHFTKEYQGDIGGRNTFIDEA